MKKSVKLTNQHFTAGDIFARHPEPVIFESDHRYAKFANDLYQHISNNIFLLDLDKSILELVVIKSTMYLEDIVSELGIWETFVTLHEEMFGKKLPFYECDEDYTINEPNIQDIKYLIWSSAMEADQGFVYNPAAKWIQGLAEIVYEYLDSQFEKVPINKQFHDFLYNSKTYDELLMVRGFLIWLFKECYLTKGYNYDNIIKSNLETILNSDLQDYVEREHALYEVKALSAFEWKTGPLAMYPKDFLAKMLKIKGLEKEAEAVAGILYYQKQVFKIEKADQKGVSIISTRREKMYVSSTSFGEYDSKAFNSNNALLATIIKYKDNYEVNGISMFCKLGKDFEFDDEKEKGNIKGKKPIPVDELIEKSGGTGLLFFKDINEYKKLGIYVEKRLEKAKNIVCYINKEANLILTYSDIAELLKVPNNPFYNKEIAESRVTDLIIDRNLFMAPCLMHLIKNNFIPDASFGDIDKQGDGNKVFQDNIEFIARYCQQECWNDGSDISKLQSSHAGR